MIIKHFQIFSLMSLLLLSGGAQAVRADETEDAVSTPASVPAPVLVQSEGFAGKYLSSHFAQSRHDWSTANHYLGDILTGDPENIELIRRSMILAMGSGDLALAVRRAESLTAVETENGLALMILGVSSMVAGQMGVAVQYLDRMEPGDMTDFIKPILKGWAAAAAGDLYTEGFNETTIHNYHGGLLSAFLNKTEDITKYADALIGVGSLSNTDAERAADLLAVLGRLQEATILYEGIYAIDNQNKSIAAKLTEIQKDGGGNIRDLVEAFQVKTPQEGAAMVMYDMAYILYQEHSDSSAKLFTHMALALNPHMVDAQLLLADTLTRNDRFEEAISQLSNIPEDHPSYLAIQRHAAELLSEAGHHEQALEKLNALFVEHNDVESLIRVGDLYRHEENFSGALNAYNKATQHIGDEIPEKYWYLLYARGMVYERQGDWGSAESDFKAALVYRPNHPYLLNYLGYGWADQGMNLEESLELIKRAVALRPQDGYIIDSLGWAQYMMGNYEEALPNLERASQLLPYDTTINDHLGDVYWRAGRRTEARFQWERALNYGEGNSIQEKLEHKLRFGLEGLEQVKQAGAE